jgi:hypothetical protein
VNFSGRPTVHFILIVRRKIVLDMGNLFRIPFTGSNGLPEGPSDMGIQRTRLAVFSGISFPDDMRGSPAISATQRLKMYFLMIKYVFLNYISDSPHGRSCFADVRSFTNDGCRQGCNADKCDLCRAWSFKFVE